MRRTFTGRTRRTHVVLTERLYRALRASADEKGVSVSALIEDYCRRHVTLPEGEE